MRAVVCTAYGPPEVLELREVAKPAPRDSEVLIKVHAASVTAGDCELRRFGFPLEFWPLFRLMFGVRRPRNPIFGQELSGEVEAVGKDVSQFTEGDRVLAATTFRFGAHAEYICLPGSGPITIKPANMTYEEGAVVPTGGLNALSFLRKANVQSGERVLIIGAGGSIGTMAVQLSRHFGADVTAVDSAEKLDMLRSIGVDHVIDYTREDYTERDAAYDVLIDVVGKDLSLRGLRSLTQGGRYLLGNLRMLPLLRGLWTSRVSGKKVLLGLASPRAEDLDFLNELIVAGKIRPVIDRRYPLEQTAEAHRYIESGHKQGSVVITLENGSNP